MNVLGIESSCDETSIAILSDSELKANLISSQDFHSDYGGVVPELSSRAHLQIIIPLLKKALKQSNLEINQIDIIAATAGPGLIGALLVGLTFGKGLAYSLKKPFVPVNHIEGHIFSGFLMDEKPEFPFLCLVVSGGHTLLLIVKSELEIIKLGSTVDDAAGEAFDKVSKLLGLGYPGGPKIQSEASHGDPYSIDFPISKLKGKYDFSFSGIKTAVLRYVQKEFKNKDRIDEKSRFNIAASFQRSVVEALSQKIEKAVQEFELSSISVVGGVAANSSLKNEVGKIAQKNNLKLVIPSLEFCGDNAAMIAYRGQTLHQSGKRFDLSANAFPALPSKIFQ